MEEGSGKGGGYSEDLHRHKEGIAESKGDSGSHRTCESEGRRREASRVWTRGSDRGSKGGGDRATSS